MVKEIIKVLEKFDVIGLDFDGTLHGTNYAIVDLIEFISSHKDKKYYIVTFRNKEQSENLLQYLSVMYKDFDINWAEIIAKVIYAPYEITHKRTYNRNDIDSYNMWKGDVCKQYSMQVLVDDEIESVYRGCEVNNVSYFDIVDLVLYDFNENNYE